MSHTLQPLDAAPEGREVRIGWDAPLATFYLQVLDVPPADADEDVIETVWQGTVPHEHPEPEPLVDIARRYADVPADLTAKLHADKHAVGGQFAGRVGTHLAGESALATIADAEQAARILVDLQVPPAG
ncbi:hypothetical protein ACIQF6_28635 [Kitasatospora sp. NPDC092948]|uniref:hypothetical protein n=1 Tax=Kitasatospora sp. NPDC092948 TaxID=3364088 RepID=UPI0037FB16D1